VRDKKTIEDWFELEGQKWGKEKEELKKTPFIQKKMAYSLLCVPLILTGCASGEGDFQKEEEAGETIEAFEQCEYEKELHGWELDCDDENNGWYGAHGYSKYHRIPKKSAFSNHKSSYSPTSGINSGAKTGIGSGGKSGGSSTGG